MANQFNKSFARACPVIRTNQNRCNKKAVRKLKQEDFVVTTPMVDEAIKEANNSKALGPDNISTLHLKKSGPLARSYIAALATLSFSTGRIPGIWKRATVIPLLKPGKKPEEAASYRPVSLLSPIARIIERIALPEIRKCVDLPSIQHGFRKGHSTTSALCNVSESVRCGLNKKRPPQRTVIVALDLKRAFDTVNHEILHKKILQSSLPGFLKIWLYGYLTGREQRTKFEEVLSNNIRLLSGVPQGGVLSPLLFCWYMSDMPQPTDERVKVVCYADDITVFSTDKRPEEAVKRINIYLKELDIYLKGRQLYASPAKCSTLLISSRNKEWNKELHVKLGENEIPTVHELRLLGVIFDHSFSFGKHVQKVNNTASNRNSILRCLTSNKSGLQKEGLTSIYKALTRSTIFYAAPAWSLQTSKTNWEKLERRQNDAMRTVTGCTKMTNISQLRHETRCISVEAH